MLGKVLFPLKSVLIDRQVGLLISQQELPLLQIQSFCHQIACQHHFSDLLMGGVCEVSGRGGEFVSGTEQHEGYDCQNTGGDECANGSHGVNDLPIVVNPSANYEEQGRLIVFGTLGLLVVVCGGGWLGYRIGRR